MCGIAGGLDTSAQRGLDGFIGAIVARQHARGPDATHIKRYDLPGQRVVLGHNRLSIIALGAESDQPMTDVTGRYAITYNGEIYNYLELREELIALGHRFLTASDTEVIIAAFAQWGTAGFARLIGMFSLGILDRETGILTLARDRFGKKPLFYYATARRIVFASSGQVIAHRAGLQPNLEYVGRGIALKYYEDEGEITPFVGLRALPSGCCLIVTVDGDAVNVATERYYDFAVAVSAERERIGGRSEAALLTELRELLDSATRLRLRSDVPMGISLSGGIDSSLLAGLARGMDAPLTAYSFSHPENAGSEGPLVKEVAKKADLLVKYVWPTSARAIEDLFWKTLAAQGAPFPHVSMLAQYGVFESARADGVKVLLGGQGGDEAFMGYRKFYLFRFQEIMRRRRYAELPAFATAAAWLIPSVLQQASVFWSDRKRYAGGDVVMGTDLVLPCLDASSSPAMALDDDLSGRQALDVLRYSLPTLLRYEDRNSMANSVESRLPLCDHRLMAFGLALPPTLKLRQGFGKYLLREASKGVIPESVRTLRKKRGFDVQQDSWIRTGLGNTIRNALHDRWSTVSGYVVPGSGVEEVFSDAKLTSGPQSFKDAVSLLWLADPYGQDFAPIGPVESAPVEVVV